MYITENRLLKYAICSNAIYIFLFFLFKPDGINPQKVIITSFLLFSVLASFLLCYRNRNLLNELPKTIKVLFGILMFWNLITIVRGFSFNIQDWVTNFGNVYMGLAWFTPLVLILGIKLENWKIVFKSIQIMFLIMLFASLFLLHYNARPGKLKTEWSWLLRPINFIIIVGINRFKASGRILVYLAFILYIIVAIFAQQRIEFIYLALIFFFLFIVKLKHIKIKKSILWYVIIGFVAVMFIVFTYGYENLSEMANKIIEFEDSRTFLFEELFIDLNTTELYFGRGSLGTYHSLFFERTKAYFDYLGEQRYFLDSPTRITIEVGYLQMILKGGLILMLLTFSFMVISAYLAIFKSKNNFVKRLGLFILALTILSLISFRPAFTPTFILLWMAIGTVLSKKNRMMTDSEMEKIIKLK